MNRIADGTPFPSLRGLDLEDKQVEIARLAAGSWGLILMYRGHW